MTDIEGVTQAIAQLDQRNVDRHEVPLTRVRVDYEGPQQQVHIEIGQQSKSSEWTAKVLALIRKALGG